MHGWGGIWFGWIFWLVILGLVIWAIVVIVNARQQPGNRGQLSDKEEALDILKKRYAKGEISQEKFE